MRYVFIVNPKAGKRGRALEWLPRIQAYFGAHPEAGEYRLHITQAPGRPPGWRKRRRPKRSGQVCPCAWSPAAETAR